MNGDWLSCKRVTWALVARNSTVQLIWVITLGGFFSANSLSISIADDKIVLVAGGAKNEVDILAIEARLAEPFGVAFDHQKQLWIIEMASGNRLLKVVERDGTIQTVVGAIKSKETARDMKLNGPKHICIDQKNRVVIADAENHLIRRYDPSDGTFTRIAGTGKLGHEGVGGSPLDCQLARPHGVTIHPETGELYITDSYNNRILKIVSDS